MEAQADSVEITVEAKRKVVVAVGRDTDVTAWVADSPAEHLTQFADRETFVVGESGSDVPLPDPLGSDLWILSREFDDGGEVKWQKTDGRWSLLIAPTGGEADDAADLEGLRLTMTWPQVVRTPLLWPGVTVGALLALGGLIGLARGRRRGPARRAAVAAAGSAPPAGEPIPALAGGPALPGSRVLAEESGAEAASTDGGGAQPPGEPAAAKPRRRWFWRRPAPQSEAVMAEEPPVEPEPPKLDLGLATPNRNWERLAAPDPRYQDLQADELPPPARPLEDQPSLGQAAAVMEQSRPAAGRPQPAFGESEPTVGRRAPDGAQPGPAPAAPEPPSPAEPQPEPRPASPWALSPDPAPASPLGRLSQAPLEQPGRYEPVATPSAVGLPRRQAPSLPPATAAQKIAALRQSHTSMADDAAATIAAAMAAAAGVGSAARLTRRQIREAERAAADALHNSGRVTGELPPWSSLGPAARPQVRMQTDEGSET
jgi:hypothetical protein